MWQALRSRRPPVPKSTVYSSRPGFCAAQINGYRVLSSRVSDGTYLTFCPIKISHLLDESQDCGLFVCDMDVAQKLEFTTDDDACAICLDEITGPQMTHVRCGHRFHRSCLQQAWKKSLRCCPLCRHPLGYSWMSQGHPEDLDELSWAQLKVCGWHRYCIEPRVTRSSSKAGL